MNNTYQIERMTIFAALFLFSLGMGLLIDGKKLYSKQLRLSERVDYQSTLNPYQ